MTEHDRQLCPLGADKCPIYSDLEQLQLEVLQLRQEVVRDPLTGLFNRRHFNNLLTTEMERSRRSEAPTSLILLDIDHFKSINDRYGHIVGDMVLQQLARTLKNTVRKIDIPCRYGGEEFVIILPATPLGIAAQVAERLRTEVASMRLTLSGYNISFTASLGVSCYTPQQQATPSTLLERADQQLYTAKQNGRNRVASERPTPSPSQLSAEEKAALYGQDSSS